MNEDFTRYSFAPSSTLEKTESIVKVEKGGDEGRMDSQPDTPRSNDHDNEGLDDLPRRPSRSISNAPSVHDDDMLDNDIDMDKNDQTMIQNDGLSDENDLPEDDGQFKRPHNKKKGKRKKRGGFYSSSHRRSS